MKAYKGFDKDLFPSPCGVDVFHQPQYAFLAEELLPSPCGVGVGCGFISI